jgi:branched-chain amino acid transport system substrate-binding protein
MLGGNDAAALIKQFKDFQLDETITLSSGVMDMAVAWQVGDAITGVYPVPFYHKIPEAAEFVKKYSEHYKMPPDNQAWQDYTAVRSLIAAMNKAGSTDYEAVVKALEGMRFDGAKDREVWYRDFDHQLIQTVYVVKAADRPATSDQWDWGDIVLQAPAGNATFESFFGTKAQIGCKFSE